jgi:hypothetical protein
LPWYLVSGLIMIVDATAAGATLAYLFRGPPKISLAYNVAFQPRAARVV